MKKDNWLVILIVAFTSLTTYGLLSDGSLIGFVRGILAAIVLDGLVVYWEAKRITCRNEKQREYSKNMMWAGVGMLLLFAGGYAVKYALPANTMHTFSIFGDEITIAMSEFIFYLSTLFIGFWVVLTLAVVLYLRGIDPETVKDMLYTEAEQHREEEERKAYEIANKHTASELGILKAMERYRKDLENMKKYTEGEIVGMVSSARAEIERQRAIPVDMSVNRYAATVEAVNPTPPGRKE